ncbi:ImmA/IrrE family metallo-endopeptidase [Actinoplanes sp. N902-109]|uniref:helix-turn-helix domain-containing protein n=1 Tax=Actinoplanes sp. (strain N902-109) TaxID=649831 RepID=UPI000329628C|nr:XRE family transcriptional regulator [Actinoplanes sp. N902-109]AGL13711.1 DNA-binding protein [Actinoplanes sp. N902-109]
MRKHEQLRLLTPRAAAGGTTAPAAIADGFDPGRLTQARQLAAMTKRALADRIGVTAAAIGQYELGLTKPRPELVSPLAEVLGVPPQFFLRGRPHARLDASMAHFRSLRATRAYQRAKAISFTELAWELTYALEKRVQLPWIDLPGFAGGEVHSGTELPRDPAAAAQALRMYWNLGTGPISHLVRRMEAHGIVAVTPLADEDATTVDAFSTSRLPRPIAVLTPNRAANVYRHRFSAAHELGHLVLHGDTAPGDIQQEREANTFAAEFLTPRNSILPALPGRADLGKLVELQREWGVSVKSLLYRCRELGLLSDSASSRAHQRLQLLADQPGFRADPATAYPGEQPAMLSRAFDLSADNGLTMQALAEELAWPLPWVRMLLGASDQRPVLKLVR